MTYRQATAFEEQGFYQQIPAGLLDADTPQTEKISQGSKQWHMEPLYNGEQLVGHHVRDASTFKARCADCGKMYNCKLSLVRHCRQEHGAQGAYYCGICARRFGQKSHLMNHKKICNAKPTENQYATSASQLE